MPVSAILRLQDNTPVVHGRLSVEWAMRGVCFRGSMAIVLLLNLCYGAEPPSLDEVKDQDWFLEHLYINQPYLSHMRVDSSGWSVVAEDDVSGFEESGSQANRELVIPVFPSVYRPDPDDKIYYDAVLQGGIALGDKVLVIGAGSGSDAWVAWLKSNAPIFVIEVNPLAVANVMATAQLAGFEVEIQLGDFRTVSLPRQFNDFDWVLWNMPYLEPQGDLKKDVFHDGDDGSVLTAFLQSLSALLKPGGRALVINDIAAYDFMDEETTSILDQYEDYAVFLISND